jgi:uncharacterized lipoprotein YmbA
MNPKRALPGLLGVLAVAGLATACLGPKADPTRYYVLAMIGEDPGLYDAAGLVGDTEEQASLSGGPHLEISVGVGPITMPGYLKRSRMVTRESDSELTYLEIHRWAQPLGESLQYALVANLAMLLRSDEVIFHPWYKTREPDYSVEVDVARFERGHDGSASLTARWSIRDTEGAILAAESFNQELPADSAAVTTTVNAQSRLVAAMSRQIADALRNVGS